MTKKICSFGFAGQSDKIDVNAENIDIGGIKLIVAQENGNGRYLLNHDYTILETNSGQAVNQFLDLTLAGNLDSLFRLDVKYDNPSNVKLDMAAEMDVGSKAALGLSYSGQFGNGNTEENRAIITMLQLELFLRWEGKGTGK